MVTTTKSTRETQKFGQEFAKKIAGGGSLPAGGQVVCLYGDLGAGKTTLVQGIAKGLGIKKRIISPTFVLIRRYQIPDTRYLYHIDLYRLQSIQEAKNIGIEELLAEPTNILLIEWPEKIESALPQKRWEIRLESIGETEREITYETLH